MTIKKLIPCTLTAAVLASTALTGCSSKGTSDKSTTAAKTSAQETKETATKSAETKDNEAGSSEENTSAEAKSEEAETELGSEEVSTEIGTGESADDLLAQIKERGSIIVAMEGTWAPWTYHDEDDNLVGYDVEVAQNIAEKLGVEVEFIEGAWDGLLAGLDAGRYDIMVNGVGVTEERAEKYNFSTPYAYNKTAVIVRGDYDEISSMEDLKGKKTANTISSTYAAQAEAYGATVTGVDDLNQTIELLLSKRIDATLNAEVVFNDYKKEHPEADVKIATYSDQVEEIAIPIRKGDDTVTLLEAVNDALDEMAKDGTLTELSEKYFGIDISKK
ncbi:MAG: transporter substrate-binding domain-containing protein [Clostridiales bacterium]|nr:transporter substrate-binding domain-containing protein [Clostridiales bacterium]